MSPLVIPYTLFLTWQSVFIEIFKYLWTFIETSYSAVRIDWKYLEWV